MRGKFAFAAGMAGLVAVSISASTPSPDQRQQRERGVIVSVAGSGDTPVTDMQVADFLVRENDVAREVLRVSPAPPPSQVYFLVDDSQATQSMVQDMRSAMTNFIARIGALTPAPQQALMSFGERPTRRVDFTPNPEALLDATKRLFPINGSGAYLLQAITDAARDLKKREAASPVIVVFVAENGPEFSSELNGQVRDALKGCGASLWSITLQVGSPANAGAGRERAIVLGDVTRDSGGMNKVILSAQAIGSAFTTVTNLISSRYLVIYGRPDTLIPPDRIEVTSRRKDVRVRASRWAGQ